MEIEGVLSHLAQYLMATPLIPLRQTRKENSKRQSAATTHIVEIHPQMGNFDNCAKVRNKRDRE